MVLCPPEFWVTPARIPFKGFMGKKEWIPRFYSQYRAVLPVCSFPRHKRPWKLCLCLYCSATSWATEKKWQVFVPCMESPTSNIKGSICLSFLLLPVAPGIRNWVRAVNRCHQFNSWQSHPLTEVSTQTASGITFQQVAGFLCRYREKHNKIVYICTVQRSAFTHP